jgi:hypothetical protein
MSNEDLKKEEENIANNKLLKKQLREVTLKIEEIIADNKKRKEFSIPVSNDNIKKVDLKKFNEFVSQIEEQKNKIESYKEMIDYDSKYTNITKDENELKYIKQQLLQLKQEHEFLSKMNKKQEEGIKMITNKNFTSTQMEDIGEKLRNLKEEYKIMNNKYKSLNAKVKNQNLEINKLKEKCQLIKANIQLKKEQKLHPENTDLVLDNDNSNKKILELKKEIEEKKLLAKNQEENYKNEINIQNKKKKNLEHEINTLETKLLNNDYEKKINELRMKEVKKIKLEINRNKQREINNIKAQRLKQEKEKLRQMNLKRFQMMKEKNKFNFGMKHNSYINEEENKRMKITGRSYKKPNLNIAKFNPNSHSSINIFNNNKNKKKDNENKKEKDDYMNNLGIQMKEHEKQRGMMIKEIEFLKDDIEKILNKNEIMDKNIEDIRKEKMEIKV